MTRAVAGLTRCRTIVCSALSACPSVKVPPLMALLGPREANPLRWLEEEFMWSRLWFRPE